MVSILSRYVCPISIYSVFLSIYSLAVSPVVVVDNSITYSQYIYFPYADANDGVVVQVAQRQQLQKQKEMAQRNLLNTAMKAGSITVRKNDNLFLVLYLLF